MWAEIMLELSLQCYTQWKLVKIMEKEEFMKNLEMKKM